MSVLPSFSLTSPSPAPVSSSLALPAPPAPYYLLAHAHAGSKSREVKPKEAQAWASKNGYMYYETSAHSGDNVQTSFHALFSTIVRNLPQR